MISEETKTIEEAKHVNHDTATIKTDKYEDLRTRLPVHLIWLNKAKDYRHYVNVCMIYPENKKTITQRVENQKAAYRS